MGVHLPRRRATYGSGARVVGPQPGSKGTTDSFGGLKAARDCCKNSKKFSVCGDFRK